MVVVDPLPQPQPVDLLECSALGAEDGMYSDLTIRLRLTPPRALEHAAIICENSQEKATRKKCMHVSHSDIQVSRAKEVKRASLL